MSQFDETLGDAELIGELKKLKFRTMNNTTDERVLTALRGQQLRQSAHHKRYRWFSGVMAVVAGLCITGGLVFVLDPNTHDENLTTATSKGTQKVNSLAPKPSSVTYDIDGSPAYLYTGPEAVQAIKQLANFKVKEPTAVPSEFPAYSVQLVNHVHKSGSGHQLSQLRVDFFTITIPRKTSEAKDQTYTSIKQTHEWQEYLVEELPGRKTGPYFTGLPLAKTAPFDGLTVNVYTDQNHDHNLYTFVVDNHVISLDFSAGNYKLGVDPLTDQNAWRIIDSLIKGNLYLN